MGNVREAATLRVSDAELASVHSPGGPSTKRVRKWPEDGLRVAYP